MDSYRIPTKSGASEYVDKRSRFLGLVRPVGSEDEAREIIAACKKQYHDARHNCWCYLLRDGTERYSDDSEPQGTAGIPMLEVFRRAGVTNAVCVVTRYFGGVLLGTGGLLRAYTAAAADALADAGISVVRRWLRAGASGWRLDVADELPDDFIAEIRDAMEQENPDSFLLGEVWEDGSNKVAYSQRRRYLLGSETHGLMNYPFRTAALDWLRGGDAACFRDSMETIREHYPRPAFYSALNILGTHDTPRILTLLGAEHVPDTKDARAAYRLSPEERQKGEARLRVGEMLLYCFPGSPTVYYGDEAGMEGFEDPLNRKTYPWDRQDRALLDFFRSLGQLRRHRPSLQDGDLTYVYAQGGALVLRRQLGDEITVAALNAGETAVEVSLPWPRDLAREALTFQQFFAPGGKLRLRLPPVSGMILI